MKFTPEVIAALQTLKDAAENDFEKSTVIGLEITLKNFSGEIWRDIAGYEGLYQVSNFGRIKSFSRNKSKILSNRKAPTSIYARIILSKNGITKTLSIHRLVAEAFIPNPENKPQVNHIDGNKFNNHVENLEWATASENTQHAFNTGLATALRGSQNGAAKLTAEQIAEIRASYIPYDENFGVNALSRKFKVGSSTVSRIVKYETYKDSM